MNRAATGAVKINVKILFGKKDAEFVRSAE